MSAEAAVAMLKAAPKGASAFEARRHRAGSEARCRREFRKAGFRSRHQRRLGFRSDEARDEGRELKGSANRATEIFNLL
jgi:hypothetical protein